MSKKEYAFVDIETSGVDPEFHEMIECGIILENPYREAQFSLPFMLTKANPKALEVNGWGKREFAPEMEPREAAGLVWNLLKDKYLVGQAVQFDAAFLRAFLLAHGYFPSWNFRLVELSALASGHLGLEPPIKSELISEKLGISNEDKHTALADAKWDREVFRKIVPAPER